MGYIEQIRQKVGSMPIILNSSGVIIKNDIGEILLEYRNDTENWGIPGGYMEPGETFEETIKRELKEELGIAVDDLDQREVLSGKEYYHEYPNGDQVYSVMAIFEAKDIGGQINVDSQEIDRIKFFNIENLPQLTTVTKKILEQFL